MKPRRILLVGLLCFGAVLLPGALGTVVGALPAPPQLATGNAPAESTNTHGYVITKPVPGSEFPADYTFVLTQDEIYVPIAVRKPKGNGPFPAITMGSGEGRGGMQQVERQVERLASMQDEIIKRGYVVAYHNYRNEIPYFYWKIDPAIDTTHNLPDSISGGRRMLKSNPTLDHQDLIAVIKYLQSLPYVDKDAVGATGVSHSGEMIIKAAAEYTFAAGVPVEGATHEFLNVDTGPTAPRDKDNEVQFQDVNVVRARADKAKAMARIQKIKTPILHMGRDKDHQQGVFKLAHEWMAEAGKDSTWVSFDHPVHGYAFIYRQKDGSYKPDPVQARAFDVMMGYFDRHLKHNHTATQ